MEGDIMTSGFDDDDDAFQTLLSDAISGVDSLRHMQYHRKNRKRKASGKPGPKARSVQMKLYHLPDACALPRFKRPAEYVENGTIKQHMDSGYGNNCSIL